MSNFLKNSEGQKRQYIDAESVFAELRRLRQDALQFRGGMIWREISGHRYLIRTSARGAHKSLGSESEATTRIFQVFTQRKAALAERLASIEKAFEEQRRLNRALRVGRVPPIVVNVLNVLDKAGLSEHFTVVGTHALHAYESASGVRFMPDAMATRDIELLFDTRSHLAFFSRMKEAEASFLGLLRKADKSFERLEEQKETARNATGFEVDVIRRVAKDGDPHPLRMSDDENDIWAVQASTGDRILGSPRFSQMVVSTTGEMALMNTIHPLDFASVKRALAKYPSRDPLKRSKDALQATLIEDLVQGYMPQYVRPRDIRRAGRVSGLSTGISAESTAMRRLIRICVRSTRTVRAGLATCSRPSPNLSSSQPTRCLFLLNHEAARAGLGVALLPPELVSEDEAGGRLVRLHRTCVEMDKSYYLMWRAGCEKESVLLNLGNWMKQSLGKC